MSKKSKKKKKHFIIERSLKREKALGQAWADGLIEISPDQSPKSYLTTLIHEKNHLLHPTWPERKITIISNAMVDLLWDMNYRRVIQ